VSLLYRYYYTRAEVPGSLTGDVGGTLPMPVRTELVAQLGDLQRRGSAGRQLTEPVRLVLDLGFSRVRGLGRVQEGEGSGVAGGEHVADDLGGAC
jgi:hypothetical protein